MDIKATKEWWNEICVAGTMTPDEAATLVHSVDDLIDEVERLTKENVRLHDMIGRIIESPWSLNEIAAEAVRG